MRKATSKAEGARHDKTGVKLPHPPSDGSTATGIEVHEYRTAGEGSDTAPEDSKVKLGEEH